MGGIIVESHSKVTRKGGMMGFFTLEDQTGQVECLMFPKVYEKYSRSLSEDQAVLVTGRLSVREEEDIKLLADTVEPLENPGAKAKDMRTDAQIAKEAKTKIYVRLKRSEMPKVQELLSGMPGNIPVYFNLPEEGITLLCPRSLWVKNARDAHSTLLYLVGDPDIKVVEKA